MSSRDIRPPVLCQLYYRYLRDEDSAAFIRSVTQAYTLPTLHRLAEFGTRCARRAAVLAVSFLGGEESSATMGQALCDTDRGVRLLAENGIRSVWQRAATPHQRRQMQTLHRYVASLQLDEALVLADDLTSSAPSLAEGWHLRAIVCQGNCDLSEAIYSNERALELNPYHFPAATALGRYYAQQGDRTMAIVYFQTALEIYPDLEYVRSQVSQLERAQGH